ncbi:MAG: CAP domain-containing protein [Oscillospiraceae bacterium]|jgi:uncharacterized protein YkwD|nr:CAP domain-containing protein [Oscillospiraceae bacterium]
MKRILPALAVIVALATLSGAFALPANAATDGYAAEVVRLTNAARADDGRTALAATHGKLNEAAQKRAEEIGAKYDSNHLRPDGREWSTVFEEYGISYRVAGENIAMGQRSPAAVVEAWMNSPGHRSNILGLKANFNYIGVGVYERADGRLCWVQLFLNDGTVSSAPAAGKTGGAGILAGLWNIWNFITGLFFRLFGL